jgi:hypothetical protein
MRVSFFLSGSTRDFPLFQQTFNGLGITRFCRFDDTPDRFSDYVVTFGELPPSVSKWWNEIDRSRKICVLAENPKIFIPALNVLESHGIVVAPFMVKGARVHFVNTHAGVPWFYGLTFDKSTGLSHTILTQDAPTLDIHATAPMPRKQKFCSLITSSKSNTPGHARRLAVTNLLKQKMGDQLDVFGFGHEPVENKAIALDPYVHTVVMENDFINNYMTEKICDAFLAYASPVYIGAPNIQNFFPADINAIYEQSPESICEHILKKLEKPINERDILINRYDVLFRHNLFYHLESIIMKL